MVCESRWEKCIGLVKVASYSEKKTNQNALFQFIIVTYRETLEKPYLPCNDLIGNVTKKINAN